MLLIMKSFYVTVNVYRLLVDKPFDIFFKHIYNYKLPIVLFVGQHLAFDKG